MKLIFISHDASRTGAPILLLTIIGWLQKNQLCEIKTILIRGGELEASFRSFGQTLVFEKMFGTALARYIYKFVKSRLSFVYQRIQEARLKAFIRSFNPNLIYANTALSVNFASNYGLTSEFKTLGHIHELGFSINEFVGDEIFKNAVANVVSFICVAQVLKKNLMENYDIQAGKITVIPEPISADAQTFKTALRTELGIAEKAFVVVGAGSTVWRKGPDLFLMTAYLVNKLRTGVHFIWVGSLDKKKKMMFDHDIAKLNLTGLVHFVGPKSDPIEYFAISDVFYLPSREDPYPLVCLEAASLGKPVVCFADAGGMPEFVREDAGFVVKFMDLDEVSKRICTLFDDRELGKRLGRNAQVRVSNESDIQIVGPKIWAVIERSISNLESPTMPHK